MFSRLLLRRSAEGFQLYDTLWANSATFRIMCSGSKVSNYPQPSRFTLLLLFSIPPSPSFLDGRLFFSVCCAEQARQQCRASRLPFSSPSFNFFLQYITADLSPCTVFSQKRRKRRGIIPGSWQRGAPQGGGGESEVVVGCSDGGEEGKWMLETGVWKMWLM